MDGKQCLLVDFNWNVVIARQVGQFVGVIGACNAAEDAVEVDNGPVSS